MKQLRESTELTLPRSRGSIPPRPATCFRMRGPNGQVVIRATEPSPTEIMERGVHAPFGNLATDCSLRARTREEDSCSSTPKK